ncbi:hypothetical protein B0E45_17010 [Sinorhizobium sp. A49]|nr:hypothetical protein B0E45_17010 [Sinorhizobium sp. A49]
MTEPAAPSLFNVASRNVSSHSKRFRRVRGLEANQVEDVARRLPMRQFDLGIGRCREAPARCVRRQ